MPPAGGRWDFSPDVMRPDPATRRVRPVFVFGGVALLLLLLSAMLWQHYRQVQPQSTAAKGQAAYPLPDTQTTPPPLQPVALAPSVRHPEVENLTEDLSGQYLQTYASETSTLSKDINQCLEMLFAFNHTLQGRSDLPPTGNRNLVSALLGHNNDRIRFLSPASPHLNDQGELVDRFGTPLFFHFQDGFMPDVRSAGPDQRLWTNDDLELGLQLQRAY